MGNSRCLQVLVAEAGRGGFLVVLKGSVAVVLVTCACQCGQCEAGGYGEYGDERHLVP